MKTKLLLLLTLTVFMAQVNAQCTDYVNIPNSEFKNFLLDQSSINVNDDNEISCTEASDFTGEIDLTNYSITDLTGIEAFTNLTALNCRDNGLTSLDISANTALETLICIGNNLTNLNISANTALKYLSCGSNLLSSLDTSTNTALEQLFCHVNNITSLILSNNTALTSLNCSSNPLTSLDVTKNTALTSLSCVNNSLSNLDVSKNTALITLSCSNNNLSNINLSANTVLTTLNIKDNALTNLNVTNNTALEALICDGNNLTHLDVDANTALTTLNCSSNSLTSLDVSNNTALSALTCNDNNLSNLILPNNPNLNKIYCQNNSLVSLDVSAIINLKRFKCSGNNLKYLNLANGRNSILVDSDADFTNNPNLTCIQVDDATYSDNNWPTLKDATASYNETCNPNVYIPDTNFKTALLNNYNIDLNSDNEISYTEAANFSSSLNVSNKSIADLTGIEAFVSVKTLYCYTNSLTTLDLSGNSALSSLYCNDNELTHLDISANTNLTQLYCQDNLLTSLNVANGNNSNFYQDYDGVYSNFKGNPNLTCIQVDDANDAAINWSALKDASANYSEDCGYALSTANVMAQTVSMYPNPTKGQITINHLTSINQVDLFTITGNKVLSSTNTTINISHLPPGLYLVKITTEDTKTVVKKIIKK